MNTTLSPHQTLKHYFGYDQFRPGQQQVVEQVLHGQDVFVLMPTGGGKSLCYQLPALLQEGVTVVISPLIALMQDQVMSLQNNGIPATFLNSTLPLAEQRARELALLRGDYKLLYVAPERLAQPEVWPWLQQLATRQGIPRLVVDEAHCISDWGHDFRPEYRQIDQIRDKLNGIPVTALTATATERVRADIVTQLGLRDPWRYVASFDRPNLYYAVQPKQQGSQQEVVRLIRSVPSGATIVYCQSRAEVERLAQLLSSQGIPALAYHAGLPPEVREANQSHFIRDQVQVMVATIAFGMGINKPDVRLVIHYDLPKTMEGYYQESGRAGRDGLPADCVLFFSLADKSKIEFFIQQKTDPQEQRIARQQLRQMTDYASSHLCRRRMLLSYFSETLAPTNCQNCDNCLHPIALEDRTVEAQKFLSCIYRSGERFGMNHIIQILRGSKNEKLLQLNHHKLSTYGIGQDLSQKAWQALGRALLQQGLVAETQDGFPVLSLNSESWEVLRGQLTVQVPQLQLEPQQVTPIESRQESLDEDDQALFQSLRQLRKQLADERSVPPFVVFSDRSLIEMAQKKPETLQQFSQLNGVGSRKLSQYGDVFLKAIYDHAPLKSQPRTNAPPAQVAGSKKQPDPVPTQSLLVPAAPSAGIPSTPKSLTSTSLVDPPPDLPSLNDTHRTTFTLYQQGIPIDQIAYERNLSIKTIHSHLALLLAHGQEIALDQLVPTRRQWQIIRAMFKEQGYDSLSSIREHLGEDYSYEEIRYVRAALFHQP